MSDYRRCLVLDSSYMARSIITTERAFVISYKGNAEVVEEHPESFGLVNPNIEIGKPSIIRVPKYIRSEIQKVPLTRENIYRRDNYECVYCGHGVKGDLTLDHVHPQSKGGKDTWGNLVTACKSCNHQKADLLIADTLLNHPEPKRPHYLMLMKSVGVIPHEWKPFLFL